MIRISNPILHFDNIDGTPLTGGWLYTFVAGTNTPVATYANAEGTAMNETKILLNSRGECSVFLDANKKYKFRVMSADKMTVVQEADNVCLLPDGSVSIASIKDKVEIIHDADYFTEQRVGNQLIVGINEDSVLARKGDKGDKGDTGAKGDKGEGLQIDKYVPTVASLTDGSQGMPAENAVWFVEANKHLYGCTSRNPLTWADMGAIGTSDTVSVDKITGILPVAKGGTGASTAKEAQNNILDGMVADYTDIGEGEKVVFKYGTPTSSNGTLFYRSLGQIWDWIKGKISSVLGLTATAYQGKAKSAQTADALADDSEYVKTSGNQSIAGEKSFNSTITAPRFQSTLTIDGIRYYGAMRINSTSGSLELLAQNGAIIMSVDPTSRDPICSHTWTFNKTVNADISGTAANAEKVDGFHISVSGETSGTILFY